MNRLYLLTTVTAVLLIVLINTGREAARAQDNPFADFKLLGETTDCTVARLAQGSQDKGKILIGEADGEMLSDAEAQLAYDCARPTLQAAYARSGIPAAVGYTAWTRFSAFPYRSATHGSRYVNNYANDIAVPYYGRYEKAGKLPAGSILAKDSFVVADNGQIIIGALALMEKMYAGYNPKYGDWRYSLILPDGTFVSSTGSVRSASVAFCGDCHQAAQNQDSLFFIPPQYRINIE